MAGSPTQVVSDLLRIDFACRDCSERPPDIVVQVLRTQESFQQHARVHGLPQGDTENACHCGDGRPCKQKTAARAHLLEAAITDFGNSKSPCKSPGGPIPWLCYDFRVFQRFEIPKSEQLCRWGGRHGNPSQVCTESGILSGRSFAGEWQEHDWSTRNRLLTQLGASN